MALVSCGYRFPLAISAKREAVERKSELKTVFLPDNFCALTKTLPFLLSLDFDSEPERPKLNIDFHFLDLVDNFLLEKEKKMGSGNYLTSETFIFLASHKSL